MANHPQRLPESSDPIVATAAHYRIGAAARLAEIPVETLRVWERRYAVVSPQLSSGGRRLYSAQDIQRLRLIKRLLAQGNAIGVVAKLPTSDLQQMLADSDGLASGAASAMHGVSARLRLLLVGEAQASGRGRGYTVVASCPDIARAAEQLRGFKADLVVIETPSLMQVDPRHVSAMRDAAAAVAAIVLYRFGPVAVIRRLRDAGHLVVHAALDAVEFDAVCRVASTGAGRLDAAAPPAARFDTAALSALAGASSTIRCECPRHLAELLQAIQAFERYSGECGSSNPADAALHARLQTKAGHARALLEDALLDVALAEGLTLPERISESAV